VVDEPVEALQSQPDDLLPHDGFEVDQQGCGEDVAVDPRVPVVDGDRQPAPVPDRDERIDRPPPDLRPQPGSHHRGHPVQRVAEQVVDPRQHTGGLRAEQVQVEIIGGRQPAVASVGGPRVGRHRPGRLLQDQPQTVDRLHHPAIVPGEAGRQRRRGQPGTTGEVRLLVPLPVPVLHEPRVVPGPEHRPGSAGQVLGGSDHVGRVARVDRRPAVAVGHRGVRHGQRATEHLRDRRLGDQAGQTFGSRCRHEGAPGWAMIRGHGLRST